MKASKMSDTSVLTADKAKTEKIRKRALTDFTNDDESIEVQVRSKGGDFVFALNRNGLQEPRREPRVAIDEDERRSNESDVEPPQYDTYLMRDGSYKDRDQKYPRVSVGYCPETNAVIFITRMGDTLFAPRVLTDYIKST